MVEMLREHPTWLAMLLGVLGRGTVASTTAVGDPTLRLVDPVGLTLDLMLADGARGPWTLVEVQLKVDADKETVWPLSVSWLRHRRGANGSLVVLTASEAVACWASSVRWRDEASGTTLTLRPTVVHLGVDEARALLSSGRTELMFFAAWALHDCYGEDAVSVVNEAVQRLDAEPDEGLRRAVLRAILNTIHERLVEHFRRYFMSASNYPESPAFRALRLELEDRARRSGREEGREEGRGLGAREGRVSALLAVLAAKGIAVDATSHARIEACADLDRLDAWIRRAALASSLGDVLDDAH